jgi:hypothetical protein
MLYSSTTNFYGGVSQVATGTFGDILPFLYVLLGIILGFFVLETLLSFFYPERYPKEDVM